ncbi:MAG: TonB-dependent receptor [Acidaminococcales bacterium]|jgi:outer membrane receptor for ferrienterochelin and colicins|nr:TonB-dependent receptor [Acidaminococcales bacterium]
MRQKLRQISKRKITALTLAALGLFALPALAAEAEDEDVGVTREVVVTATRTEQEVKETPSSVQVITRQEIETLGAQTVRDALALAVGVDAKRGGMAGKSARIRGMSTNHTLILVDGRRMASEDTSALTNVYEFERINLDNVERIEIVRGPGSSLYGSEAMGGVINIITRRPEKAESSLRFEGGNHAYGGGLRVDSGTVGRWALTFDTYFQRVRDKKLEDGTSLPKGPSEFYNLKGTYSINDNNKIDFFYEKTNEHLSSWTTTTYKNINEIRRDSFGLAWRGQGGKSDYELRAYYNRLDKDMPQVDASGARVGYDLAKFTTWVVEGRDSIQLNDAHRLTFGGEYRSSAYYGTRLGSVEREIKYQAAYLQDEWLLNEKLLLIPSLRYDHSDRFGGNLSPKLGLTYKFNDDHRLKTSFGRGFRAPTISELYMDWQGTMGGMQTFMYGNPDLKPEKSTTWEISLEAEKNDYFGKIAYFHNNVRDLINMDYYMVPPPPPPPKLYANYVNVGKARIEGLEFELGKNLNKQFTVKVSHVYLDAIDKGDGSRLEGRSRNSSTLQLRYNDARRGWSAVLWNDWFHDYLMTDENYSYSTLNFSVNKKWRDGKYSAWFAVENLTDKKINDISMYEGRVWRLGLNITL